jgi:lipopolysaccharide transport system ATP-binding protein
LTAGSSTLLVSASGLGKDYPRSGDPGARLRAFAALLAGRPYASMTCLDGISFDVHRGQSLGIIGENGAGKSTLLKLLTGVLQPTRGSVTRQGRVGALLELGAGFDTEQTGRSNIALAAGLMGWSRAEIRGRGEEIIAFADIGRYIDEPVKHYSSGMVVRLGFAVIAAVRPDLLITDEVLAVGDESFQKKCVRWIEDYLDGGGTLLLVSHSMYHVQKLCTQALWLKGGRVEAYGDVFDVTQDYLAFHERKTSRQMGADLEVGYSGDLFRITRLSLDGDPQAMQLVLRPGDGITVEVDVYRPAGTGRPQVSFGIVRADGSPVFGTTSEIDGAVASALDENHVRYVVTLRALPLLPGSYSLKLHAMDPEGMRVFDTVDRGLTVRGQSRQFGMVRLDYDWS